MAEPISIFFAGGGTGGHLYPGIAVAQQLRQRVPDARLIFLCTEREIDKVILEPTGFEFITQPIVPWVKSIRGTARFLKSWGKTKSQLRTLLKEYRPTAVLGLGGYAAGAAVQMAAKQGIPTAILNPDVIPGQANQYLMKHCGAVCCQFAETAEHVPARYRDKLRVTGCPIRHEMTQLPNRAQAKQRLGLRADLNTLVITGASLGAQTVNDATLALLQRMPIPGWQVLHLAGRDHATAVRSAYAAMKTDAVVVDFTPAMADVWAVADLCISRCGASSCAELTACGVPSLLMPYPYHKDMHQRANAKVLADAEAAILIDDEKDAGRNAAKLHLAIEPLLQDAKKRAVMAVAAQKLGKPDAAQRVADVIVSSAAR